MVDLLGCCGWQLCKPIRENAFVFKSACSAPRVVLRDVEALARMKVDLAASCPNNRIPVLT
jgi:hypothetical protein